MNLDKDIHEDFDIKWARYEQAVLYNSFPRFDFDLTTLESIDKKHNQKFEFRRWARRIKEWLLGKKEAVIEDYKNKIRQVYELLNDQYSRDMYLQLCLYRKYGGTKVRLPLYNLKFRETVESYSSLIDLKISVDIPSLGWKLGLADLRPIGFDIKAFLIPMSIYVDFVLKQYQYGRGEKRIQVELGDVVIDLGGFTGDTALYFAHEVGNTGEVHVFEFIPSNLAVLHQNLNYNPLLKQRIKVVSNPAWSFSGKQVFIRDRGPMSILSFEEFVNYDGKTDTLSVDDYVESKNLTKVDFIKMDIEGAEQLAIEGAMRTIKKYRPKLAISIYHSLEDFVEIPLKLNDLNLGYEFYLDHYTIHRSETILYALPI